MTSAIGTAFEITSAVPPESSAATPPGERDDASELAYREDGGLGVGLWWDRSTGELTVSVRDRRSGIAFDIPVESRDPLEVFNHPYAYAQQTVDGSDDAGEERS